MAGPEAGRPEVADDTLPAGQEAEGPSQAGTEEVLYPAFLRLCHRPGLPESGVPHWHPHQLKHACGTEVRKRFGAEAARAFLGHAKLSTTEIYAERDLGTVEEIAPEIG